MLVWEGECLWVRRGEGRGGGGRGVGKGGRGVLCEVVSVAV